MKKHIQMKRVLIILSVSVAMFCTFFWGYMSHRNKIFPHSFVKFFAFKIGLSGGDRFQRKMIESKSKRTHSLLRSIGYVEGTYDPNSDVKGVIAKDKDKAFHGYRFFNSRTEKRALLIDNSGEMMHQWTFDTVENWHSATLMPNGDILVIVKDYEILKIDKNSRLLWRRDLGVHHDLDVYRGEVYVLTRQNQLWSDQSFSASYLEERIAVLSKSGLLTRDMSLFDAIMASKYKYLMPSIYRSDLSRMEVKTAILDMLHSNSITVFDGSLAHQNSIFSDGNLMICMRNINAVIIFDPKLDEILWLWGPNNLTFPHHPTVVENGNILIFDNGTEKSRVVEVNPDSGGIEWLYEDEGFFSETRGSAQRLPNGNTLITESDTGYVFEVTSGGKEVWRYANPDVREDGTRGAIWRMTAFARDELDFLEGLVSSEEGE